MFHLTSLFLFFLHLPLFLAMSDTLGHNPQHEFGSVYSRRMTPLLPFWRLEGDAFANQDFVRVVPDRQSKKGAMWNSEPCRYESWEVTLKLEIHGVSSVGADGMVFWYVENPSQLTDKEKSFFGYTDKFRGLGVVLDTYDNDNTGLHPLLGAIVNDGSKSYTHDHDHHDEGGEEEDMEVGYCQLQIRNLGSPSLLRVTYSNPGLRVEHQLANSQTWVTCLESEKVTLPPHYYFGITAATGQLADNHDVYGLTMKNLSPDAPTVDSQRHFSQFDKYQISEYLSKIYYEVAQPKSAGSGPSSTLTAKQIRDAVSSVTGSTNVQSLKEQLDLVYDGLLDVTESLEKLEKTVGSRPQGSGGINVQTLTQVMDNQKVMLTEEIRSVRSEVYSLQNHLSGMSQMTADLKNIIADDSESSGSGFITYVVIALSVLCFGIVVYIFVKHYKEEKEKKLW